ncbi:fibronectin type III domain-containing protein 1-like [Littorina saxatilis]|uniref:Uncharacterized protein n=1 Tax=Littorina saxatilis TaxID=31220 RepID=A0AAN9BMA5_9CAEN
MPSREPPSYSSSRVQRASRLNALEQARLQHKMMLLEKGRLHQARLTNQDIRLTSTALEYILNSSGHSPEGRGPSGQPGGQLDPGQEDEPCFLYGERVISRKVRRMPRPHSAMDRSSFCRNATEDDDTSAAKQAGEEDSTSARGRLPPRPQSSPAKGRMWLWSTSAAGGEDEGGGSEGSDSERAALNQRESSPSRPSTGRTSPSKGRVTPHQAWEDDTDEVTRRLLKVQKQQQQHEEQLQQQQKARRYMQDIGRMRSQTSSRGFRKNPSTGPPQSPTSTPASPTSPSPRGIPPSPPIEDRKPVSPHQKRGKSAGALSKRAGLTEIMSQASATMTAGAWRAHLASTQTMPRSAESQQQFIMEARRNSEKQRQQHVMHKMETFMGTINKDRN